MLKIFFLTCIGILAFHGSDSQPLSGLTAVSGRWKQMVTTQVIPPYSKAISKFSALLEHLATPVAAEEDVDWDAWARQASGTILGLHSDLQKSHQGSQKTVGAMNKELEKMATESSRIDSQLLQKTKEVETLGASVSGAERSVQQAQQHLNEAQRSLESHERAVREAEAKYNKAKNKCFKRKKRDIHEEEDEEDSGVPVVRGLRHKRGLGSFIKRTVKKITKPVRKVAREVRKGICRTVGTLTGSLNRAKNNRNNARNNRDAARNRLNQRQAQLRNLQNKLRTAQASLNAVRRSKEVLEGNKRKLLGEIGTLGRLNKDLKDVTGFIGGLKVRGAKLVEVVEGLVLLDAELFLEPLQEAADLIRSRAASGASLPLLPSISDSSIATIQTNLAAFTAAVPDFPLIILDD